MKEFYKTQKVTYNLMTFTGFKALLIFAGLIDGPKSFKEMKDIIENHPYLHEKVSTDTIRVYMNSLKHIGCEIKRIKGEDKISRYIITSHPFELKISEEQKLSLLKVYKILVKTMDIQDVLYLDNFFKKIGKYIKNDEFISELKKYSPLKNIDEKIVTDLLDCCEKKYQLVIRYNSPNSGEKNIKILPDKIDIQNGKIYLCGIGFEYNQYCIFPISRIKEICEIKIESSNTLELPQLKIIYEINSSKPELESNEKLISSENGKSKIEITTSNKFQIKQKLLSLGADCKILEPADFRDEFIALLNDMKAGYYND
jgi:predicted DNA-binding transcriptional regulator YafY